MKTFKKIAAVMLAVVMVMSLGIMTAFASTSSEDEKGSITITEADANETYYIYKMMDVTYDGNGAYSYTVATEWVDFFNSTGNQWIDVDAATGTATWKSGVVQDDSTIRAFAAAALAWAKEYDITPTSSQTGSETIVFSDLDLGYYLINTTLGTILMIDTTDPDATIADKNGQPTVDKEVEEDSTGEFGKTDDADIGDTVNYEITISNILGAENLVLHDIMSAGLTLDGNSFEVYIDGVQIGSSSGYTVLIPPADSSQMEDENCTFEIVFDDSLFSPDKVTEESVITIKYSATINEDAVIGMDGNTNKAQLDFGEEHDSWSQTSETTTYVWGFNVFKYTTDAEEDEHALAGAEFILGTVVNGTEYYAIITNGLLAGWTTDESEATVLISPENGLIQVAGFDSGNYFLRETKAPDGYNALAEDVQILIANEDTEGAVTGAEAVLINGVTYDAVKVLNNSGTELPGTGGIGTTIFYIVGGVIVLAAVVILITRRRMSHSEG